MRKTRVSLLAACAALVVALSSAAAVAHGRSGDESFSQVRSATARFHDTKAAQAAGWDLREGLDNCFDKPGVGGMGVHFINTDELGDLSEDPLRPEALVYAPSPSGLGELVAVEYIVPAAPWDAAGNSSPPELFGRDFHLDPDLGVYVLHAWIFKANPSGAFEDFNPKIPLCPAN